MTHQFSGISRFAPIAFLLSVVTAIIVPAERVWANDSWSPLDVDVWNPPFNSEQKYARQKYTAIEKAARKWTLCASIPHLKDAYWLAVNYGLISEAQRINVSLSISEAGGYERLDVQRRQIGECMAKGADALIIGAISAEGLNDLVAKYTGEGKPVIDLINGISSDKITARAAADFSEMGRLTGEYLANLTKGSASQVPVAWFPGPEGAGWSKAGDGGLRRGLTGSKIQLVDTRWGDTGLARQTKLVDESLTANAGVKFIVGTAVTAEAAVQELRRRQKDSEIRVLAYYFAPGVHRGIQRGTILAAPSDRPVLQARLSVDLAVRAAEKQPFPKHIAAPIQVIDASNITKVSITESLAPDGFRPVLTTGN